MARICRGGVATNPFTPRHRWITNLLYKRSVLDHFFHPTVYGGYGTAMGKKADSKPAKKDSKKDKREADRKENCKKYDKSGKNGKWKKGKSHHSYDTREEKELASILAQSGLVIHHMEGDGNCMFRSIADQITGDCDHHMMFREKIMKYITEHADHFSLFMEDDEKFEAYVERMNECNEWGGHQELYAASQCLNTNITVYQLDNPTYVIQAGENTSKTKNIKLSYHGDCHYNSVRVDPNHISTTTPAASGTTTTTSTAVDTSFVFDDDLAVVQGAVPWLDRDRVVQVLQQCKGDVDAAIELLCAEPDTEARTDEIVVAITTASATTTTEVAVSGSETDNSIESTTIIEVVEQMSTLGLSDGASATTVPAITTITSVALCHPEEPSPPLSRTTTSAETPASSISKASTAQSTIAMSAKDKKYRKSGEKQGKPISKKVAVIMICLISMWYANYMSCDLIIFVSMCMGLYLSQSQS